MATFGSVVGGLGAVTLRNVLVYVSGSADVALRFAPTWHSVSVAARWLEKTLQAQLDVPLRGVSASLCRDRRPALYCICPYQASRLAVTQPSHSLEAVVAVPVQALAAVTDWTRGWLELVVLRRTVDGGFIYFWSSSSLFFSPGQWLRYLCSNKYVSGLGNHTHTHTNSFLRLIWRSD